MAGAFAENIFDFDADIFGGDFTGLNLMLEDFVDAVGITGEIDLHRVAKAVKSCADFDGGGFDDVIVFFLSDELATTADLEIGNERAVIADECCFVVSGF